MLAVGFLCGSTVLQVIQPFLLYQGEFIDTFIMYSSAVFMDLVIRKLKYFDESNLMRRNDHNRGSCHEKSWGPRNGHAA